MSNESSILVKTTLGLASYSTGIQIEKDKKRREEQAKRSRAYERKYRKRHK